MTGSSLRRQLLTWLLVPLLAGWVINFFITYSAATKSANEAYDRTLLGAALAIAEKVVAADGRISVDLPDAALEMLESNLQNRVYYKVGTVQYGLVTGYDDLPSPPEWPRQPQKPVYFEADYRGETVRIVNVLRPVYDPTVNGPVLIQVGETLESRRALSRRLMWESAAKELALIVGAAVLIWIGVSRSLRPLLNIRRAVASRDKTDLTTLSTEGVPREVKPLIVAINSHVARLARMLDVQRRFVSDASHQLKTPLTVLKTQAELALRQQDLDSMREIVRELVVSTEATARLVNQLLALARSEPDHVPSMEAVDLAELARRATFEWLTPALNRRIDLGFEGEGSHPVRGNALLLREMLGNLIDNAVRYTPDGGCITVRVGGSGARVVLEVEDNGPGIPLAERVNVFDRFHRLPGSAADGCGLGLAIVKEICATHGAAVELGTGKEGKGLTVRVAFARIPAAESGRG